MRLRQQTLTTFWVQPIQEGDQADHKGVITIEVLADAATTEVVLDREEVFVFCKELMAAAGITSIDIPTDIYKVEDGAV